MNMMKGFLLFFLFSVHILSAQKITVQDKESTFPIYNVTVNNEDKSIHAISDKKGIVDISAFAVNDILTFTHLAYVEYELLKRGNNRQRKLFTYKVKAEQLPGGLFFQLSKGKGV